jgi:mono/diheme cytochrome c family protein
MNTTRRWLLISLGLTGLLLLGSAYLTYAAPPGPSVEEGEALFAQYCAGCHTIGGGDLAGPDLAGVADRRDADWLEHWLAEPDQMIADGDPIAVELLSQYNNVPMPNQHLSLTQIDSLLMYLGLELPSHPDPQTAPVALMGDAQAGRDLFTGSADLAGGGTACMSCHSAAGLTTPGGGLMGPDLTLAVQRYGGEAGLRGTLGTIAFPSMVPVYLGKPLTPQEQADLAAFLATSAAKAPPKRAWSHVITFLLAFAVMDVLLVGLFIWHRRLPQHRRRSLALR